MKVTKSKCEEWRRKVRETDATLTSITDDSDYVQATIHSHLSGKCTHEIDTEPLTRYERSSRTKITPEQCASIKKKMREENSIELVELSDKFGMSSSGIIHHLRGECGCSNDVKPVERKFEYTRVDKDLCETIRDLYKDIGIMSEVARKTGKDNKTVRYHIKGKCSHADEDLDDNPDFRISKSMCDEFREKFINGSSALEIASEYSVEKKTVQRHVKANCQCHDGPVLLRVRGSDVVENMDTILTKGECLKAREMYWEEYEDPGTISDFLGFEARSIMHHVTEECDHEFGDDIKYVFV